MRGLRKYLTPFAPDQSGAESVLYELGGIIVILDAGGCAGNICGFDEPRWSSVRSAVFSAGLRDMDAVMGRDELLVKKIADCVRRVDARFVALIGTPVPAVIGTDLAAAKRMLGREIRIPVLTVATDGMHLYDRGEELAYRALLREAERQNPAAGPENENRQASAAGEGTEHLRTAGVFGVTPLDLPDRRAADLIRQALYREGYENVILYGSGASLDDYAHAGASDLCIAASADGIESVRYLKDRFGTPYEIRFPGAEELITEWNPREWDLPEAGRHAEEPDSSDAGHGVGEPDAWKQTEAVAPLRVLIVQEQVLANSLREVILRKRPSAQVTVAGWFGMDRSLMGPQDVRLREEDDFISLARKLRPDLVIGDRVMQRMIPDFRGRYVHIPQFAVSGKRMA